MHRLALSYVAVSAIVLAQPQPRQPKPADMSTMSPEAHAPLFQAPKSTTAGTTTARLTAALPASGASERLAPRNFVDQYLFDKMKRDAIPHAPLATDQEFLRRCCHHDFCFYDHGPVTAEIAPDVVGIQPG